MVGVKDILKAIIPDSIQRRPGFVLLNQAVQIQVPKLLRLQYDLVCSRIAPNRFLKNEQEKYNNEFYRDRMSWYVDRTTEVFHKEKTPAIDILGNLYQFSSVLDIACGIGLCVNYFTEKGYNAFGIDLSSFAIDYAKNKYPHIAERFQSCSATSLPFADNSIDVTFSYSLLPHLATTAIPIVMSEMYRITNRYSIHITTLKKSGWLTPFQHHLTVKPRHWWAKQFLEAGFGEIDLKVQMRTNKEVFILEKLP